MTWRKKLETFNRRLTVRHRLIIAGLLIVAWLSCTVAFRDADVVFLLASAMVVLMGILTMEKPKKRRSR